MKFIINVLVCILDIFFYTSCNPNDNPIVNPPQARKILYSWNFSESSPLHDLGELNSNVNVVEDPLDPTNKVLQFVLLNGEYRTEASVGVVSPHYFNADTNDSIHGDEFWVEMRILKYDEPFTGSNTTPSNFKSDRCKTRLPIQVQQVQDITSYC